MTLLIEPKPKPAAAPEKDEPVSRSITIGIACTLLFHLLLLLLLPQFSLGEFSGSHRGIHVASKSGGKSFDIQLAPREPDPVPDPLKFVETNPDAPENTPDKTPNISNRNQQSAQPDPAKEKDPENRPSVKGQDEIKDSDSIVSGDMSKPQNGAAARPESTQDAAKEQAEMKARMELVPLAGTEKIEGPSPDGIAANVSNSKKPTTHADQAVEGAPNATDPEGGLFAAQATSKAQPKARPRLTAPRPTILSNRITGTSNIGILGRDARWNEYGEYLNELIEIVQAQWYRILDESRVSPPRGSHVIVTFKINAKGETEIVKVEDSNSGRQGVFSCQNAITYPQPYRKWTDQMIAVLGNEQTLTFSFYYQ